MVQNKDRLIMALSAILDKSTRFIEVSIKILDLTEKETIMMLRRSIRNNV